MDYVILCSRVSQGMATAQCSLLGRPPPLYKHVQGGQAGAAAARGNYILLLGGTRVKGERLFLGKVGSGIGQGVEQRSRSFTTRTRASQSDVPAYKGYPPMQTKPPWYWRLLACIPYMMPLCESWMYAETAYNLHCFIEQFEFWTYPFLTLLGRLPSWFLLAYFFVAYLGIVRKNIWPHFFRFHVVTGMLLEILLQVLGTCNDWIPQGVYWGKIGAHFWLAVFFTYFLTTLESIRCALSGMYADIPFISDAAYMQIPYD